MVPLTNSLKHAAACRSMPQRAKIFLGTVGACWWRAGGRCLPLLAISCTSQNVYPPDPPGGKEHDWVIFGTRALFWDPSPISHHQLDLARPPPPPVV